MESAAACTISRALWLRDPTRMVSLLRCTMSLDAAPHGFGLKSTAQLQSKSIQAQKKTRRIGFARSEASLGCTRLRSGEETVPESRRRRSHLSHCHRKSTPPYARAAERAQARDVHCVLDPSNPSKSSDGAPLDQLCPSMRGCLSIRAAVNAHSAATKDNDTTSNDRSGRRPGH